MTLRQLIEELVKDAMNVQNTLEFIKKAHSGQKYGSVEYWKHPLSVSKTGKSIFGSSFNNEATIAALLHDVVEDTSYSLEALGKLGYSKEVLDAVALLTKDKALSYEANIQKIVSSGNKTAMMVKFADNYENYTGKKSHWPEDKRNKSQMKYKKSMETLGKKLGLNANSIPE